MFRSIQRGDYLSRSFIFSINLPHTNTRLFLHLVPPGLVLLFVAPPHPNLRRVHLLLRVLLLLLLCGGRRARGGCFQESPQVHRYQSHVILRTPQEGLVEHALHGANSPNIILARHRNGQRLAPTLGEQVQRAAAAASPVATNPARTATAATAPAPRPWGTPAGGNRRRATWSPGAGGNRRRATWSPHAWGAEPACVRGPCSAVGGGAGATGGGGGVPCRVEGCFGRGCRLAVP